MDSENCSGVGVRIRFRLVNVLQMVSRLQIGHQSTEDMQKTFLECERKMRNYEFTQNKSNELGDSAII